jgi:Uma2 family endonuclease
MFRLPNSAMRLPDAACVSKSRLSKLSPEQKKKFLPLTPEFVIELTSPSDRLPQVEEKMHEWMANGVQLGWLIDPEKRQARVFRADSSEPQVLDNPASLNGDGPVAGFRLDLQDIWEPGF